MRSEYSESTGIDYIGSGRHCGDCSSLQE